MSQKELEMKLVCVNDNVNLDTPIKDQGLTAGKVYYGEPVSINRGDNQPQVIRFFICNDQEIWECYNTNQFKPFPEFSSRFEIINKILKFLS